MHSTDTYDVRRGKRIPKLLTAYFPNYMDRFEALLALMRVRILPWASLL